VPGAQTYAYDELGALFKEGLTARTAAIAEGGRELAGLLAGSSRSLGIGRAAPAWRSYVESIGALVLAGLTASVLSSSSYLASQASLLCRCMCTTRMETGQG